MWPKWCKYAVAGVFILIIGCIIMYFVVDEGQTEKYALLVAGSKGYDNYRHQADVLHAYHRIVAAGIPKENIVVMMYDDIAYHPDNPTPGVIVNYPGGPNLYENVTIDYTGADVNAKNFLSVLTGNKRAVAGIGTGKVIDNGLFNFIFVYFAGHGVPGVMLFPDTLLFSDILLKTISRMNRFGKMLMYVDSSYSGSFFENLVTNDLSLLVVTSGNKQQQSYACFYDDYRKTFLGDVFTLNWIKEGSTEIATTSDSVNDQFKKVREATKESHVQSFGRDGTASYGFRALVKLSSDPSLFPPIPPYTNVTGSFSVTMKLFDYRIESAENEEEKEKLLKKKQEQLEINQRIDKNMEDIINTITKSQIFKRDIILRSDYSLNRRNILCYHTAFLIYTGMCFSVLKHPHAATHLYKLINMCTIISKTSHFNIIGIARGLDLVCRNNTEADHDALLSRTMGINEPSPVVNLQIFS